MCVGVIAVPAISLSLKVQFQIHNDLIGRNVLICPKRGIINPLSLCAVSVRSVRVSFSLPSRALCPRSLSALLGFVCQRTAVLTRALSELGRRLDLREEENVRTHTHTHTLIRLSVLFSALSVSLC